MTDYRDDGWPLCPQCGEDELMSGCVQPEPRDELRCLACGWSGVVPPARWCNIRYDMPGLGSIVHTLPIDDTIEHAHTSGCPCSPRVVAAQDEDHCSQIIHNAADQRELVERHGVQ